MWQLCHTFRTSKRHWNEITIFRSLPTVVQKVSKNICFARKWFCAWKYYKNPLHVRLYPSIQELKGRNAISLCTFLFTLLPLVSASMSDTVVTSMIEVTMRMELTCEVILSRDPKHLISISNCAPDFLDFRDSMCSMITFDDWNIKVLQ